MSAFTADIRMRGILIQKRLSNTLGKKHRTAKFIASIAGHRTIDHKQYKYEGATPHIYTQIRFAYFFINIQRNRHMM